MPPALHIRPARRADLAYIAEAQARSAYGDEFFRLLARPGTPYSAWYAFVLLRVRLRFASAGLRYFVAEDESSRTILGFISLEVEGEGKAALRDEWNRMTADEQVEKWLVGWEQWYRRLTGQLAVDLRVYEQMGQAMDRSVEHLRGPHLHCINLNVRPEHQGKGVGKALLGWAMDLAHREGLPMTLQSSMAGLPLYKKMGWVAVSTVEMRWPADGAIVFACPTMAWGVSEESVLRDQVGQWA